MEASEWIIVSEYKPSRPKKLKQVHSVSTPIYDITKDNMTQKELAASNIVKQTKNKINNFLKNIKSVHVQALGLGNFHRYTKPRIQFYLLKQILQELKNTNVSINVYDPVFDKSCLEMLKDINATNYPVYPYKHQKSHIIYYMPHCQKQLYKQILEDHPQTSDFLIIGNSFKEYLERQTIMGQQKTQQFMDYAEQRLSDFDGAFNDTYIMTKQ